MKWGDQGPREHRPQSQGVCLKGDGEWGGEVLSWEATESQGDRRTQERGVCSPRGGLAGCGCLEYEHPCRLERVGERRPPRGCQAGEPRGIAGGPGQGGATTDAWAQVKKVCRALAPRRRHRPMRQSRASLLSALREVSRPQTSAESPPHTGSRSQGNQDTPCPLPRKAQQTDHPNQ